MHSILVNSLKYSEPRPVNIKSVFLGTFVFLLALAPAVFCQNRIIAAFPLKDGFCSSDSSRGDPRELFVADVNQTVGWIVFNPKDFNVKAIKTAIAILSVKSVQAPGICSICALYLPVTMPESKVKPVNLHFDDLPIATLTIDRSSAGQSFLINVTEQLKSGRFKGLALRSINGLVASFVSKEGFPAPAIICTYDLLNPRASKWFTGVTHPDPSWGHENDFFVQSGKGVVFQKTVAKWDSVVVLTPPLPSKSVVLSKPRPKVKVKPVIKTVKKKSAPK